MLSAFRRIWNKNQQWIDKTAKRMRPSKATMFKDTVGAAINLVLEIDELPKETIDNWDHIFNQISPISSLSLYIDQLRLAITEPREFIKSVYFFYVDRATEINKTRSQEQFFHLLYTYRIEYCEVENPISNIFGNFLLRQLYYLNPNQNGADRIVCGITTYGEIMTVKNPYPGFGTAVVELNQCSDSAIVNVCKSHGLPINSNDEYNVLYDRLDLYLKHAMILAPFIDEYTYDILPDFKTLKLWEKDTPLFGIMLPMDFYENSGEIISRIQNRRRKTLPLNGVTISFRSDDKDFPVQRILMKEVFRSDKPTVLYKAETLIGDLSGYYDISSSIFCNILTMTNWAKYEAYNAIQNMIIYLYACIVLDKENGLFENKYRRMSFVKDRGNDNKPLTLFPYEIKIQSLGGKKEDIYQLKCKDALPKDISVKPYITRITKVPGYTRSVPKGDSTSQIAKDLAQKVGIELKEGETYVRPHEKTVHTLKQDFPWKEHTLTAKRAQP